MGYLRDVETLGTWGRGGGKAPNKPQLTTVFLKKLAEEILTGGGDGQDDLSCPGTWSEMML